MNAPKKSTMHKTGQAISRATTATIVLCIAFRDYSPTLTAIWQYASSQLLAFWTHLISTYSSYVLLVGGVSAVHVAVFVVTCSIFTYADWNSPEAWMEYKIQEGVNVPLDRKKFWKAMALSSFNVSLIVPIAHTATYFAQEDNIMRPDLPSIWRVPIDFVITAVCYEFCFYYGHRLLHMRPFYKHIHKVHHDWTAPISITAVYAHPIEHVFCNIAPALVGPLLIGSHMLIVYAWVAFATFNTIFSHSGYHLPFLKSAEAHDYHHLKFNEMYGVLFLDSLHGTDKTFRKSQQGRNHHVFYDFSYKEQRVRRTPKKVA